MDLTHLIELFNQRPCAPLFCANEIWIKYGSFSGMENYANANTIYKEIENGLWQCIKRDGVLIADGTEQPFKREEKLVEHKETPVEYNYQTTPSLPTKSRPEFVTSVKVGKIVNGIVQGEPIITYIPIEKYSK